QVYPLANLVDVLHRLEKPDAAANALGRLRAVSATLDMDLPIVKRIMPVAEENHLPADWRRPLIKHDDLGPRPALDTLGPGKWSPPQATTFSLTTTDGRNVRLEDYSGRPVVLIFYLGFGCLHCVEQLQTFGPMAAQFEEAGISLLAISTDSDEAIEKSLDKVGGTAKFPIPLISDASLDTFKVYRAFDDFEKRPMHATVVLDGRGRIVWQDIGPEPFTDAAFVLGETKRLLALWK
ncbi:MAG TPA: peroxiredoxin family protein, partial [Pirellulales bacterium]|nr:peroxiredoxin family protein [Pirellulales bacterium]